MRMIKTLGLLVLLSGAVFGRGAVSGFCENGNVTIQTLTANSTNVAQGSYPSCRVTVFLTGTITNAAIFSDNSGTTLANPFTADSSGRWQFFADDGTYDVRLDNGGIPSFLTFTAKGAIDPFYDGPPGMFPRTKDSKLSDLLSIKDYGAKCDGTTNDFPAFGQAALAAISVPITVIIPPGVCIVGSSISLPINLNFTFMGGQISPNTGTTFTIQGSITGNPKQILFTGAGQVVLSQSEDYAGWFGGNDCGVQINTAYAALPSVGGKIHIMTSCTYITPILFGTANKPVILEGLGDATALTYNSTFGTAITLDYGHNSLRMGHGLRDFVLTGAGNSTATTGVQVGATNGAQGFLITGMKIQSFGVNMQFGDWTWIGKVAQSMIRDGGVNVLYPGGLTASGENTQFDHVTFADAPPPHTNSVWMQSSESTFTDCSFDQAQLTIGASTTFFAQINLKGTHFENPNTAVGGSVDYSFIHMNNHNGNYLSMTDTFVEQDRLTGSAYPNYFVIDGGKVNSVGLGMFSPIQVTNVFQLSGNVNIDFFSYNDLSGNTAHLLGGSTTGFVTSFPGASAGATSGFNNILGAGDLFGGTFVDIKGNVKASGSQFISGATTGTQPFQAGSTTPVVNLFASPVYLSPSGTQVVNTIHSVVGEISLSGGTATVNFTGAAVFPSSIQCTANDRSGLNPVRIVQSSSSITILGTGSDLVTYNCTGY